LETTEFKLNLGAGLDVKNGFINHDIIKLDGIDQVHNLNTFPWPWKDSSIDYVLAKDVIEHLDEFILVMEELHRIVRPGGRIRLSVPYWNSSSAKIDPTHKRGFHEKTFHFFDPHSPLCQERHYYSTARFLIKEEVFVISPFAPYFQIPGLRMIRIKGRWAKRICGLLGNLFSNLILDLEIELEKYKND
jgi:SAM-dependent methyltransferase